MKDFLTQGQGAVKVAEDMMKSRNNFPPGGFCYIQAQTGWEAPPGQSFNVVTQALIDHRKANLGLVKKHHWATDFESVANEVDAYNDARCRAHGWLNYVSAESDPSLPFSFSPRPSGKPRVAAGAVVKHVAAGVKTLLDWLGHGGRPVERELAYKRSEICSICPLNGSGGLERFFTVPAAAAIKLQLEIKNDLKLTTPSDGRLGVCTACDCPLSLKVWAPLEHILKEMDEETFGKLNPENPRCWILSEQEPIKLEKEI